MSDIQTRQLRLLAQRKRVDNELVLNVIKHLVRLSERLDQVEKNDSATRLRGYPGGSE